MLIIEPAGLTAMQKLQLIELQKRYSETCPKDVHRHQDFHVRCFRQVSLERPRLPLTTL